MPKRRLKSITGTILPRTLITPERNSGSPGIVNIFWTFRISTTLSMPIPKTSSPILNIVNFFILPDFKDFHALFKHLNLPVKGFQRHRDIFHVPSGRCPCRANLGHRRKNTVIKLLLLQNSLVDIIYPFVCKFYIPGNQLRPFSLLYTAALAQFSYFL